MALLDLSMLPGGMGYGQPDPEALGWLNTAQWNRGAIPPGTMDESMAAAEAQAAREAAALRLAGGVRRQSQAAPDIWSQGTPPVFGSLAPEMGGGEAAAPAGLQMPEAPAPAPAPPPSPFAAPSSGPFNSGLGDPFKVAQSMLAPSSPGMAPELTQGAAPNLGQLPAPMEGQVLPPERPLTPPAPRSSSLSGNAPTGSLLDRIGTGINNNAELLLALGAGFAGAPSLGEGMRRAFTNAGPLSGRNQTVDALVARGMPMELARAAASNPAIMQHLIPSMFGPKQKKFTEISVDPFGRKQFGFVDEVNGTVTDMAGNPIDHGSAGTGGFGEMLAPGVKQVDSNLAGVDYLNQFSPDVKAAVKNYIAGDTMPTGNPRMTSMANYAKMIAQKIGPELGLDVSDTKYAERAGMRKELAKTSPASMGGQLNFAGTSMAHLADVAEKVTELNNSNGLGFAPLAKLINSASQLTTDQAAKANAVHGAVLHYGQEVTKFYAGSPGGEAERTRFLKTMDTAKSNKEIANAIRTERDLIPGRVDQLHGQIETTFDRGEADRRVERTGVARQVEKINHAIARLDPDGPEAKMLAGQAVTAQPSAGAAPAASAAAPAPGNYVYDPATGGLKPR